MNPTYHRPLSLELVPVNVKPGRDVPDMFILMMRYRPEGFTQVFSRVHVPKSLQHAMLRGDVRGVHLETLEINSPSQHYLSGQPNYVVLGVETHSGTKLAEVPTELTKGRITIGTIGLVACLIGAALAFTPYAWVGALGLVLGSHCLRNAMQVPISPFKFQMEHA